MNLVNQIPLSLYIHIPWCIKKCPYCDFNSHNSPDHLPENEYINQLLRDFSFQYSAISDREIVSIFIGGGTPSLFQAKSIKRLLDEIKKTANVSSDCEVTMEANPGTFERERFSGFRDAGVNRLSIGVQSFNAEHLQKLGRVHSQEDALSVATFARNAGFNSFNLDLMFALPNQSPSQAIEDLQKAIELSPQHLSWYQLTLEPNTVFYRQPPQLPDDDQTADIQAAGVSLLEQSNYSRYEISAYSKDGQQCKHNLNYWHFGDYLGIGAGAHAKITADSGQINRYSIKRHPNAYLQSQQAADFLQNSTYVSNKDIALEFMMNALRLVEGSSIDYFESRTGLKYQDIAEPVLAAQQKGLLEVSNNQIKPTQKGLLFLNETLSFFFID